MNDLDHLHLRHAIAVSARARTNGNHPFGAILVDPAGEVVAEAENSVTTTSDVTAHAETNLVRAAGHRWQPAELADYTMYSSCEPCAMCSGAIFWAGIGRVAFALSVEGLMTVFDNRPDAPLHTVGLRRLLSPDDGVEVAGPALEEEAMVPHQGFWSS